MSEATDDPPELELLPESAAAPAATARMRCPFCGTEHDPDQQGRFCDGCGLSIAPPPKLVLKASTKGAAASLRQALCAMCGAPLRGGRCPSCG